MAEGKKGFILYADQKELFDQLSDQKAGVLIKHVFKYVNDENPVSKDMILNLAFTPIKQQLKRDLKHWESIKKVRSKAGIASAEARAKKKHNPTQSTRVKSVQHNSTQSTVIDNVNVKVNDTVNVKDNVIVKEITKRWFNFYENRTNIKPSFDGVQGKSLKSIIKHIEKQQNPGQKTEDTFQFILDRWNVLDDWLQSSCLDLKILNSKINVVLDQIKNAKGNKKSIDTKNRTEYFKQHYPDYKNL